MKKLLLPLLICLAVVSCKKDDTPSISVSPSTATLTTNGGTVNANVAANCIWSASCTTSGVSVSPASASGNSPVSVTVPANETGSSRTITVTFTCKDGGNKGELTITQEYSEEDIHLTVKYSKTDDENFDYTGGTDTLTIESNYPWTATITSPATISAASGEKGTSTVIVTIPKNEGKEVVEYDFSVSVTTPGRHTHGFSYGYEQDPAYITYGGTTYKIVKMKDGNLWMAENLRYVPDGFTPSSDLNNVTAGIYYPVKLNDAHTKVEFSTDKAVIESNGYLYQSEVALGLKVGDLTTEDQAKGLEGTQGICPAGWHVPTATEIVNLVGKAVSPYDTKTDAPYYDADKGNGTIEKLNADGFNADAWGAVSIQDNTKTSGTLLGYLKTKPDIISSGFVCGSTYVSKTEKGGAITNFQFLGFMPMAGNGTFNGSKISYRIAAPVRCVRDAQKAE